MNLYLNKLQKSVLLDKELSLQSKTLYSFLLTMADQEGLVKISRQSLLTDVLNTNWFRTYYPYYCPLSDRDMVEYHRGSKESGEYYILHTPEKIEHTCTEYVNPYDLSSSWVNALPPYLLIDKDLTIYDKAVYTYMVAMSENGVVKLSYDEIANVLGCSKRKTTITISLLGSLGYIEKIIHYGYNSEGRYYKVILGKKRLTEKIKFEHIWV